MVKPFSDEKIAETRANFEKFVDETEKRLEAEGKGEHVCFADCMSVYMMEMANWIWELEERKHEITRTD